MFVRQVEQRCSTLSFLRTFSKTLQAKVGVRIVQRTVRNDVKLGGFMLLSNGVVFVALEGNVLSVVNNGSKRVVFLCKEEVCSLKHRVCEIQFSQATDYSQLVPSFRTMELREAFVADVLITSATR